MNEAVEYKAKTRLYLDQSLAQDSRVQPSADQAHYLAHVLRLRPGAPVLVFNGRDGEWAAEYQADSLPVLRQTRAQMTLAPVALVFAPLKKDQTDFVIQKATELGATSIHPVFTAHSNTLRLNQERATAHAIEAAEQSHRLCVPKIHPAQNLAQVLATWPQTQKLFWADEMGGSENLAVALTAAPKTGCGFLIGPEGGFSAQERQQLSANPSIKAIHLGPRILRAETAAIACLSVYQALAGDWR